MAHAKAVKSNNWAVCMYNDGKTYNVLKYKSGDWNPHTLSFVKNCN